MILDIYVVNAFSKDGTGGNAAAVAITDIPLSEQQKTHIAGQLGYSETAFVSRSPKADFKLEYFTPEGEVPLCGHATIGTFIMLKQLSLLKRQSNTIETKSGVLNISIDQSGMIFMAQNLPQYFEILNSSALLQCFSAAKTDDQFPIQIVSTGLKDILLPIANVTTLENMVPNFGKIAKLSKAMDCVGIHAFSLVCSVGLTAVCRNFAPLYGIDEESATGTSSCALACYLFQHGVKKREYIFEQGRSLNSVSELRVKIESHGDVIDKVSVGGTGYQVDKISMEVL